MDNAHVVSIHIAPTAEAPVNSVREVRAIAGKGLEADRYFAGTGFYSNTPAPWREITLIESEAIAAAQLESGIALAPGESRRNVTTRGVALNHLVGKDFRVGETTLHGIRLCEPCVHLEGLTRAGVKAALQHRGGLRAEILVGGIIRVGDQIALLDSAEEKNKHLIRRYYEEMWNPWNFAACEELLSPEIVFYGSLGVATKGIPAFREYMKTVRDAFPDFHNTIEELVSEDDKIVARLTFRGTHRGEIFGVAPTGRKISYAGAAFFKIENGKVAEGWVLGDRQSLLQQLGAPPIASPVRKKVKQ